MIKGILFDVDGVIFNSEPFIRQAFTDVFASLGARIENSDFEPIVGTGEITSISYFASRFGITLDVEETKQKIYARYAEVIKGKLKAFDGVTEFIHACKRAGLKLAIATSSDRKKFLSSMAETGLDINLFDAVICGDEVVRTKPSGDIYRYAAAKLCLGYEETIVAEDALNGLSAARDAECSAIGISTSFPAEELLLSGADFVIPSFAGFGDFSTVEEFNRLIEEKIQRTVDTTFIGKLVEGASRTLLNAYAPYSKFRVGAAILTGSGNIHCGCNVENASFGATRCAEQGAALACLSSEGPKVRFLALAVASESEEPAPPCAICRQILSEFCNSDMQVYLYSTKTKKLLHYNFSRLLPQVFVL